MDSKNYGDGFLGNQFLFCLFFGQESFYFLWGSGILVVEELIFVSLWVV